MSLDYIDARDFDVDPTGSNSSADGLDDFTIAMNAAAKPGYLPGGDYAVDRRITATRQWIIGPEAGPGIEGRATIVIPKWAGMAEGVGADDYWQTFLNGGGYKNLAFSQPDQTRANITGTYPALSGSPDSYPAVIKSEHHIAGDGSTLAPGSSINGGRGTFENILLYGVYAGARVRDDDPIDQKGVAGFAFKNIRGYCLAEDFVVGFISGGGDIDALLSQSYWPPAGRADDPDQAYFNWRRQNATVLEVGNKSTGLRGRIGARGGRWGLRLHGGYRGADSPEGPYRGLRSGRLTAGELICAFEQVERACEFEEDGYANGAELVFTGHPVDDADPTSSRSAIYINTNRDIAGNLSKRGVDPEQPVSEENPRVFRQMSYRTGWAFNITARFSECSGPALHIGPNDGHGTIEFTPKTIARFSQGDPTLPCILIEDGARTKVIVRGGKIIATRGAGQIAFRVPSPIEDHIYFDGTQFLGVQLTDTEEDQAALFANRNIFSESCRWNQRGTDPDIDEDPTGEGDD